ncbi:MAG: polysaccharide biosynthesis protein [Clostridia bacterium]|nr:polysaccharide biosynthesis protein [Clostridia bacterium]
MKILLLTCNTGQGHNSTANSIAEKFSQHGVECVTEDALAFLSPKMSDFIASWHVRIYRYAPVLFGFGYEFAEKHPSTFADDSVAYNFFSLGVKKLEKYVLDENITAIICVHMFPALMVNELVKNKELKVKTAFVATDYTCSPGVGESNLDVYFIPHKNLVGEFVACGIPEENIIPSGIPVKDMFYSFEEKREAKKQVGVPENARHILMMCGSMGCGPMETVGEAIKEIMPEDAYMTIVCGTNKKLKKKVDKLESERVRVLGFTDKVSLLMDSADLYVTKPGGLSITEASYKRLPLAFIDAVSGCESYNRYFFITQGMALASNDPKRLPALCVKRLYDEEKLSRQREIMQKEFNRNPAEIICEYFLKTE